MSLSALKNHPGAHKVYSTETANTSAGEIEETQLAHRSYTQTSPKSYKMKVSVSDVSPDAHAKANSALKKPRQGLFPQMNIDAQQQQQSGH